MEKRLCKICGKEFIPSVWNKVVCDADHYHPCPICGKPVLSNKPNRQNCACSTKCGQQLGNKSRKISLIAKYGVDNVSKLQLIRNKISKSNTKPVVHHYRKCRVCGKEFDARPPYTQMTCSPICRGKYRKYMGISKQVSQKARQTMIDRYGVSNPRHIQQITKICSICGKEFITAEPRKMYCDGLHYSKCPICGKLTEWKNYGKPIEDLTCSIECKVELRRKTNLSKYGCINAINSEQAKEKSRKTCLNKYGVEHYSKTPEYQDKKSNTMMERYGVKHAAQSREQHIKMSDTRKQCIASDGTKLEGSYELKVYEYCLIHKTSVERQIPIKFNYGGKEHTTFIDFRVDGKLVECKGGHLLQGCFDYAGHIPIDTKLQVYRDNDVLLIVDSVGYNHIKENNKYDLNKVLLIDNIDMLEQMLQV